MYSLLSLKGNRVSHIPSALEKYPSYETTIGIEVHVQLTTASKIFCGCPNSATSEPNQNICAICTGQPGVLPVFNKQVMVDAVKAGLATYCKISPVSEFSRKHYFYPDLPKGYQVTQHEYPICTEGHVAIKREDGTTKKIRIMRIHIEEDAGKNIHSNYSNESFVDLNRAGTPLLEIVTHPDIENAYEAREYLKALRLIVQYLGICSGNMEEGAFRADTNISVRKKGAKKFGTRCELKNINSFKFISDAIEYETLRQIELLESGQTVRQETRLWDTKEGKTVTMRSKEEAADYRYFREPDLPLIKIDDAFIENIRNNLPELPYDKFDRFIAQGLTPYETEILLNNRDIADYYEIAHKTTSSKSLINWILRDVMGFLKDRRIELKDFKITPAMLAKLVTLLDGQVINNRAAQEVFADMANSGIDPELLVKEKGLEQVGNSEELEKIIIDIVASNPEVVANYKSGKDKLFGFFVGQAMQKTKGKGNPQVINELLKKHLA